MKRKIYLAITLVIATLLITSGAGLMAQKISLTEEKNNEIEIAATALNIPAGNSLATGGRIIFILNGDCYFEDMTPVDPVTVCVINLDTGEKWPAQTSGNHYSLILLPGEDISVGETLRIVGKNNSDDPDLPDYVCLTDHVVTQEDIDNIELTIDLIVYPTQLADCNLDGAVNAFDIDPFVLGLSNPQVYYDLFCVENIVTCDCNDDGLVNAFDIDPFVALLIS